jgi:ATP-binding cassette subfamily C protein
MNPVPGGIWSTLLHYARPHARSIVAACLLSLLGSLAALAQPLVAGDLVARLGAGQPIATILALLALLLVVSAVLGATSEYILGRAAESVVLAARLRLVGRILRLRMSAMERAQPGDLMSRVTSDTVLLREVATRSVVNGVTASLTLVAMVALMAWLDLPLLGVTLGVMVLVAVILVVLLPQIQRATRAAQDAVGQMGSALERILGAFRTMKASVAEGREAAIIRDAAEQSWRQGVRSTKWTALAGTAAFFAVQVSFLAVLGVGGARVASGAIEIGTLVAFLLFLFYLLGPIGQLVQAATQLHVGAAAIARIGEVEAMEVEAVESTQARPVLDPAGPPLSVAFEDVTFRYRDDLEPVHRHVSFSVSGGGLTAFVGPSGAGKSTVFSLIERFYQPTEGRVLLDGYDIGDIPLAELRGAIGYVEQDAPVLAGSIRDNLRFAAPDATEAEMRDALRRTRLDELVGRLPEGLDTDVGHRGGRLSGGERQRVAIARALLRRPRLLLMDEATSQLDAMNEMALRDVVADAARTTTVLVVAHRLSTVTLADRIIVMDAGEVRAIGTHRQLVEGDPLYAELAATQFLVAAAEPDAPREARLVPEPAPA